MPDEPPPRTMISMVAVDYYHEQHSADLVRLLDAYARDPMGGGCGLGDEVKQVLPVRLARCPGAFSFLAYVNGEAAGLINCFEGFSTFAARPLVNVHDLVVLPPYRGRGIARMLLGAAEAVALHRGCCKLTLEVLSGNATAQAVYLQAGFSGYALDDETGHALFWEKKLPTP